MCYDNSKCNSYGLHQLMVIVKKYKRCLELKNEAELERFDL